MALLEVRGLKRHFGAVRAVDGVDLSLPRGEVRAVIGPNGAGKSTLFNLIAGRLKPTVGDVRFDGESIAGWPLHRIVQRGIGVTFQVAEIFPGMSVAENVASALLVKRRLTRSVRGLASRVRGLNDEVDTILAHVGLLDLRETNSSILSHGDRKALEIAIALAGDPRLLLLDEPTSGMSIAERASTVAVLTRLRDERGLTILFTEHDIDMVLAFADRVTCMTQGRVLAEGAPNDIRGNEAVAAAYLGRSLEGADGATGA